MANISKKFFYLFVFVLVIFVSGKFSAGSFIGVHKAYGYGGSSGGYSARVNAVPTAPETEQKSFEPLVTPTPAPSPAADQIQLPDEAGLNLPSPTPTESLTPTPTPTSAQ